MGFPDRNGPSLIAEGAAIKRTSNANPRRKPCPRKQAKSEAAEPTIVEVIVEEHQRLRADFNKLESVPESDRDSRESMWAKLKKDLLAHHEAEEEALFANLVQTSDEARHESLHAVSEHGEHKKVLEQMEALSF